MKIEIIKFLIENNLRVMASEKPDTEVKSELAFDFKSFMRVYKEKQLQEREIKSFVKSISIGAVNDFQLCAWLCSVHEKPLKFCKFSLSRST